MDKMRCQFEGRGAGVLRPSRDQTTSLQGNTRVTFWSRSGVTDGAILLLTEEGTIYVTNCEQCAVAGKRLHGNKPR